VILPRSEFDRHPIPAGRDLAGRRRAKVPEAIVALARRLAVIIHRIWVDGTEFRWTREVAAK
jgi:hypothetical protein